uniref:RRM domain-containing protein n=1 Tax=Chrysotila carterae TaxID=13221 RepID=A0A7S4C666_CHRCT
MAAAMKLSMSLDEISAQEAAKHRERRAADASTGGGGGKMSRRTLAPRATRRPAPYAMARSPQGQGAPQPGRSVYVGNLSWAVAWHHLKDHFKAAGEVEHADVMTEPGGRSKGYGIVVFRDARGASQAIRMLHDTELLGRKILVRENREEAGGGVGAGQSLYVGNLAWDVSWQDLKDHFKSAGTVLHADVMMEADTGRSKGCGLVVFANARDAENAIATLHDSELKGRQIFVREDREGGSAVRNPLNGGATLVRPMAGVGSGGGGVCKVFVGNLPFETTWPQLKDIFREAGNVIRADVAQAADGRSLGHGTVVFASAVDAANAIQRFNGADFLGRSLKVLPQA